MSGGDNPFSEPDDSDRTVIRPAPGGRRPAAPASAPQASGAQPVFRDAPPAVAEGAENLSIGTSPLAAAAAPLLQLLARLRNTLSQPDAGDLRERAVREVRNFEQSARSGGVAMEQLRPAHYALCASLDDVVLATPWGSQGGWAARSLVSTFHQEVRSGERFFDVLTQMRQNPGLFLPVIELMYLCLSLGYMGRYRLSPRGPAEIDRLREETYALIVRQRGATEPDLSPHWKGVAAAYRPARAPVPVWVAWVVALAIVGGLYAWFSATLNGRSDRVFETMLAAPPARMPAIVRAAPVQPPPPPPASAQPDLLATLRTFLAPEIAKGQVSVLGTDTTPIIRVANLGLFGSGSAVVQAPGVPLLEKIGAELKKEPGRVQVIGYTDNEPIHTVQFPSNYQLSKSRAQAAMAILARTIGDPSRMAAEGRADADPIAPNTTAAGRQQNRRIEIVLQRQG
ncbi:MAG TPA: type IVB secretion system protein IcmH/DotU [Acetobacteraceae bacterium]|nr:type IVB secretion system protein IcmH/DotU [Acetobacteraceae bacterium]